MGISKILNYGLKISKYNIIARVDAVDINDKDCELDIDCDLNGSNHDNFDFDM
jgi:hypothetical protein